MILLTGPYAHHDPEVRETRYRTICQAMAELILEGKSVFAPIAQNHLLFKFDPSHRIPSQWLLGCSLIKWCDEVWVVAVDGHTEDIPLQVDIAVAMLFDKPIRYYVPESVEQLDAAACCTPDATRSPTLAPVAKEAAV